MSGDDESEKEDTPAAAIDKDDVDPIKKFLKSDHFADQRDGKPRITGVGTVPVANYSEYVAQLKKSACLGEKVDDGESVSSVSSLQFREFVL